MLSRSKYSGAFAYHLGRLTAYLILGVTAAAVGKALDKSVPISSLHNASQWIVGTTLLAAFLATCSNFILKDRRFPISFSWLPRFATRLYRRTISLSPRSTVPYRFTIGLASAFLPCSWLYVFVAVAAISPHPALTMATFWLGGLPALAVWQHISGSLLHFFGRAYPKVRALVVVVAGLVAFAFHSQIGSDGTHACHEKKGAVAEKYQGNHPTPPLPAHQLGQERNFE